MITDLDEGARSQFPDKKMRKKSMKKLRNLSISKILSEKNKGFAIKIYSFIDLFPYYDDILLAASVFNFCYLIFMLLLQKSGFYSNFLLHLPRINFTLFL